MSTSVRATVKRNLRELKRQSGLTWAEIAERVGVRERQVYRWSDDEEPVTPNDANLEALAKVFEVEVAYFYTPNWRPGRAS